MTVPASLDTVAVIGNGLIGHGMAQTFAAAGQDVVMIGRSEDSLAGALDKIAKSLAQFEAHGLIAAEEGRAVLARIRTSTKLEDAAEAQLVCEAVPANKVLQDEIYGKLDAICAPPTVIASGSGQPASDLTDKVKHRGRVVAAHFWYPPQLIPLVEVCAGPETDPDVAPWVCDALRAAGKEPVIIDKEIPGFLGNRFQYAILREAWALWAEGVASAEAIDAVVKASIGRRLAITGPIESADAGGLDTLHAYGVYLIPHLHTGDQPAQAVTDLVEQGHRGLPSGKGIYDWSKRDGAALLAEREEELFRHLARDKAKRG